MTRHRRQPKRLASMGAFLVVLWVVGGVFALLAGIVLGLAKEGGKQWI